MTQTTLSGEHHTVIFGRNSDRTWYIYIDAHDGETPIKISGAPDGPSRKQVTTVANDFDLCREIRRELNTFIYHKITLINEKYELFFEGNDRDGWAVEVYRRLIKEIINPVPEKIDANIMREEMFAVADEYGLGKSLRRELRVIDAENDMLRIKVTHEGKTRIVTLAGVDRLTPSAVRAAIEATFGQPMADFGGDIDSVSVKLNGTEQTDDDFSEWEGALPDDPWSGDLIRVEFPIFVRRTDST